MITYCLSSVCPLTLLKDSSSKMPEVICLLLGRNVAWVGGLKIAKIVVICVFVWLL